jgi:hypothetical protein
MKGRRGAPACRMSASSGLGGISRSHADHGILRIFPADSLSFSLKLSPSLYEHAALVFGIIARGDLLQMPDDPQERETKTLGARFVRNVEHRKSVAPTHCPSARNVAAGTFLLISPPKKPLQQDGDAP